MTKQLLIIFSFAFIIVGCGKKTDNQNNVEQTTEQSQEVEAAEEEQETVYGVDLGLSVNWEECNVDASKPSEVGFIGDINKVKKDDGWRLPTDKEWKELISECEWTYEEVGGMKGARITAANGNSIFLPACGMAYERINDSMTTVDGSYLSDVGSEGNYWCTSDDYFNMMSFHTSPVRAQMMIIDYNYLLAARRVHDK